jgi:hypothetical protein
MKYEASPVAKSRCRGFLYWVSVSIKQKLKHGKPNPIFWDNYRIIIKLFIWLEVRNSCFNYPFCWFMPIIR